MPNSTNATMTANPMISTTPLVINQKCNNVFHLGVVYEGKFLDMLELSESKLFKVVNETERRLVFDYINDLTNSSIQTINNSDELKKMRSKNLKNFNQSKLKDALKSIIYYSLRALEYRDLGADVLFTCNPIIKGGSQKKNRKYNKHKSTRKCKK